MPIDHAKLPITDVDRSRAFYTAALAPLGWKLVYDDGERELGYGAGDGGDDDEPLGLLRGLRSLRVGSYRIIYQVVDTGQTVRVAAILHRSVAYARDPR